MTIGELVGFIDLEDKGFGKGVDAAGKGLDKLQSATNGSMSSIESTVSSALSKIESELASGMDPAQAIADLDKLEKALDDSLASMVDEADQFAAELDKAIDDAFDDLDDKARRGGEDAAKGLGDGLEGAGGPRMRGAGSGLMTALKGLGWIAAGAAIGQQIMDGLTSAMDAESAKQKLFAQLGTTPAESEKIGRVAGQVYASAYGESMGDVTDAIRAVVQNMDGLRGASEKSLSKVAKRAMDVATIMDEDVGAVTRAVSQLMRTGLAKNAEEAFDIIVKGTQMGLNKSEDLLDSFNEYGTQFRSIGLDGKTALGLIQQGLKAGARDADVITDTIKEFAIEAVKGGDNVKKGFKDLGLNADDMVAKFAKGGPTAAAAFDTVLDKLRNIEDPAKRNAVAVELFGTKAEDMAGALYALDPSTAVEGIGQVGGAAKDAGDKLHDTAANKLEEFKRGLEQKVVTFIGDKVLPALEDLWEGFDGGEIGAKLQSLADTVGEKLQAIKDKTLGWVEDHKEQLQELKDKFDTTFGGILGAVEEFTNLVGAIWDEWGDEILTGATATLDQVQSAVGGFFTMIGGIFKTATAIIKGDWSGAWEGIKQIFSGATANIRNIADTVMRQIVGDWGGGWDQMKKRAGENLGKIESTLKDWGSTAKKAMSKANEWLVGVGKAIVDGLIKGIKSKINEAVSAVTSLGRMAIDAAKKVIDSHSPSRVFAQIGAWTVEGFVLGIRGNQEKARTTVAGMLTMVKDAFKAAPSAPDALVEWVSKETTRLQDVAKKREGIIQAIADAKKYASDIAKQMVDFANVTDLGLGEGADASNVVAGLNAKLNAIKRFASDIQKLAKMGLNKTTLRQIIEAGPDKGLALADMLVGADGAEIKAINRAQKQIDKVSKQMGKNSADALYDVGKQAGQGFLKGLQGQLKETESMMAKIAKAVVAAAKKELGVKSPSRVFMGIGDNTMLGFIRGIVGQAGTLDAAMSGVLKKLVDQAKATAIPLPSVSSSPALASLGGPSPSSTPGLVDGSQSSKPSITNNFYSQEFSPAAVTNHMWFSAHAAGY
ncbi:phage tail tape measure protein [Microtetraspora sp. AC03309]|uniref:phage tail tape measure protein n=1 Tax=Microtetraspora sp. AC03309 TaxID=2779376 RepID=UPI001E596A50|nr:phage tail tape measure protein [Microtetraspora sp. AC03309]